MLSNQPARPREFASTLWSVVFKAGSEQDSDSAAAMEQLARLYWYPLYAFARHTVKDGDKAMDLTQSFFALLLEKRLVARANPARGRFRSFLLTSFKNFIGQERIKTNAAKRGGGEPILSFDAQEAEIRFAREPADHQSPDKLFERRWALTLIETVLRRLGDEMHAGGRGAQFERLQSFIGGEKPAENYASAARDLGSSEGALRTTVHRMKQRYRELVREEVAQTVSTEAEFEEELRHLFRVLAS